MTEIRQIFPNLDATIRQEWEALLAEDNLRPDGSFTAVFGVYDENQLIGTGAYDSDIIKCIVLKEAYRGGDLMNQLISYLMSIMAQNGTLHYFVYTKPVAAVSFSYLGFSEIARTDQLVFMEQGIANIDRYLTSIKQQLADKGPYTAVVINANPFTLGHRYLVEQANQKGPVIVFVVAEDRSVFSYAERLKLVKQGLADLSDVTVVSTEHYLVSNGTFPSYFLKDHAPADLARAQAKLDASVFLRIAETLQITDRFVGSEPLSKTTEIYNEAMSELFKGQLHLQIVPRETIHGNIISATKVRQAVADDTLMTIKDFVPTTTYDFLQKHITELQTRLRKVTSE